MSINNFKLKTKSSFFVSNRMGLGCMGMSEFYHPSSESSSIKAIHKALELGVNFFDTADMYGVGENEKLLGKALKSKKEKICISTKVGIARSPRGHFLGLNLKPKYIRAACERSLKNLGVEKIDLYSLHRLDPDIEVEETIDVLKMLIKEGKVEAIGLSEVDSETIERAYKVHPITAIQNEYSLWTRYCEESVLETCEKLGVAMVAYAPLGRGFLTGTIEKRDHLSAEDWRLKNPRFTSEAIQKNKIFLDVLKKFALSKGATSSQIALAWVLSKSRNTIVIPGTTNIKHLEENIKALGIKLTNDELNLIESKLPFSAFGDRY